MAGSIRVRPTSGGKRRFQARLDTPTGELVKTFDKRGDAKRWLDDRHAAILRAELISPQAVRMTVDDLADLWMDTWPGRLAPKTQEQYRLIYRAYIKAILGPIRLDVLTTPVIQTYIDQVVAGQVRMVQRGRFKGQPPAPATVHRVHATLASLLKEGVRRSILPANPAHNVMLPRVPRTKPVIWTSGELLDIIDRLPDHWRLRVRLSADTGIRAGELWGLQWRDLDGDRLMIRRALKYIDNELVYGPTKTYQERVITLPPGLASSLKTGREGSAAHAPIFTAIEGGLVHHGTFLQRLWKPTQRLVFPIHRQGTFHALRHRHASLLLGNGAPVIAVSKRLGHSSVRMTLDTYGHLLDDADGRLTDLWASI